MGFIEKLRNESKQWAEMGIITADQRGEIIALYPEADNDNSKTSPIFMLFAVVGALLIGTGVILVFATNWWLIPVEIKIVIAFVPLVAAMVVFAFTLLRKYGSPAFREAAALMLVLSVFAVIALIGQIFHSPRELDTYITVCILLSLPSVYILNSKAAATVYVSGAIGVGFSFSQPVGMFALIIALFLPFAAYGIYYTKSRHELWYLLLLLTAILSYSIPNALEELAEASYTMSASGLWIGSAEKALVLAVGLVALDAAIWLFRDDYISTPPLFVGLALIMVVLIISSFPDYAETTSLLAAGILAMLAAGYGLARVRSRTKRFIGVDLFVISALIIVIFNCGWLAANIVLSAIGVYYVYIGNRSFTFKYLNFGMVTLVFVIAARFFDSGLSILMRGIVFITLGIGFLCVNYLFYRRKKTGRSENM